MYDMTPDDFGIKPDYPGPVKPDPNAAPEYWWTPEMEDRARRLEADGCVVVAMQLRLRAQWLISQALTLEALGASHVAPERQLELQWGLDKN